MAPYDFVHLALLAVGGGIRGKTKLQKTVYFLGVLAEEIDNLAYQPHYYGPYSQEVAACVSRLVALGFVNQSVGGSAFINESGFEVLRYDYQLNDEGRKVAEMKRQQEPGVWKKVGEAVAELKAAGDVDYMKLSIAAKTHFMLDSTEGATMARLVASARRFGWSVTEPEVEEAAKFLERLGLVEIVGP